MSSRKCKLKQQWDTTTDLLECPKSGTLTTANAGKDIKQQELLFIAAGNAKMGKPTLEDSLGVSLKTKCTFTIWSSDPAPWYLPKELKNVCQHKNLHTDVYSSFIHNCTKLEATTMFFSRWMNKSIVVQPDSGILLSAKKT